MAMRSISSILAGIILWGGAGYLMDRWLHTGFIVAIGCIVGMSLGVIAVIARAHRSDQHPASGSVSGHDATVSKSGPAREETG